MKKYILSALVFTLVASVSGVSNVSADEFNSNRNRPTGLMERKEIKERKPTDIRPSMTPENCDEWKLRVVRRSTKLSDKKTEHLKVYAQMTTNLKMLLEKKGATATQVAEIISRTDTLVASFSADVDAQIAKMASADKLDCTKPADIIIFRTDLKALEETVRDDIREVREYVTSIIRMYAPNRRSGRRDLTPSVSVSPSAIPSASPSATPVVVPSN